MTSLETLLAAANFVEANTTPDSLAHENIVSAGATNTQRSVCTTQQLASVQNVKGSEKAEESKSEGSASSCLTGSTRQTHNKLEKNRRAVLKDCFEGLKKQIPSSEDRRSSNLDVLQMAVKYVQTLKLRSRVLEKNRSRLRQQNCCLQQRLVALQLHDLSAAPPTSPSTDTADDSPFVSDDNEQAASIVTSLSHACHAETNQNVHVIRPTNHSVHVTSSHNTAGRSASGPDDVTAQSLMRDGETASILAGMHVVVNRRSSSSGVGRSQTIAEITGSGRKLRPSQLHTDSWPLDAGRLRSSSNNNIHSTDSLTSDSRPGTRHGRTVVQMLQDSLFQKARSHGMAAGSNSASSIGVAHDQTGCAQLPTSTAALELMSPALLMASPTAAGGLVFTLEQQQPLKGVDQLTLPLSAHPKSLLSESSQQISSVLSPTVGQLVLCPTPTAQSQFHCQSAAAPTPASSTQFCTILGPMTSVPLLPVSALVQSVQVMPVSPMFVAGNVSGPSTLFMVPN